MRPVLRGVWGALIALAGLLAVQAVEAHEAAMGVIEFREVRTGVYVGRWTREPLIGGQKVHFRLPAQCTLAMPQLACGRDGLVGSIGIDNLGVNMSAVIVRIQPLAGEPQSYTLTTASPVVSLAGSGERTVAGWLDLARTYINYGIDHILLGVDHLLFVLGLIWIVANNRQLVQTITAFTIGHSISLAAAAFGVIGIPERPLNACIALSIVFVGVEIVKLRQGKPGLTARRPWAVAGAFGLVHGIGFASALAGLGLERKLLPAALLFFNIGVEIGQILFVVLVLLLMWAQRRLGAGLPGWWGVYGPAYFIGGVAAFWFIGRVLRIVVPS